eukprot:362856-Chlamydomonas_euryale.AAC.10
MLCTSRRHLWEQGHLDTRALYQADRHQHGMSPSFADVIVLNRAVFTLVHMYAAAPERRLPQPLDALLHPCPLSEPARRTGLPHNATQGAALPREECAPLARRGSACTECAG